MTRFDDHDTLTGLTTSTALTYSDQPATIEDTTAGLATGDANNGSVVAGEAPTIRYTRYPATPDASVDPPQVSCTLDVVG